MLLSLTIKKSTLYPIFGSDVKIDDATHAARSFEKICYYTVGLSKESRVGPNRSKHGSGEWGEETSFEVFKGVRSGASTRVPP